MNAMIFAAGLGTRLKPLTDTMPKALVPVNGRPLLDHVLDKLTQAGAKEIVINVHHFAEQIKDYLSLTLPTRGGDFKSYSSTQNSLTHKSNNLSLPPCGGSWRGVIISDETSQLLETGGGLKKALPLFTTDDPVLIHNVDILSNIDLADFYQHSLANDVTLLVSERKTTRYLLFDNDMRLVGWTNTQTGEIKSPYPEIKALAQTISHQPLAITLGQSPNIKMYAFSGIHCVNPSIASLMTDWPDRFPIMDFYLQTCDRLTIRGHLKQDLQLLDVGKLDSLSAAEDFLKTAKEA